MREKEYGIWQTHSWSDMAALVEQIACGLHLAGLQRGDLREAAGQVPRIVAEARRLLGRAA